MTYATDGKCHNSEPGTFNHECGKPAMWIGTKANGFQSGFCLRCRVDGFEARAMVKWEAINYRPSDIQLPDGWTWERVEEQRSRWNISENMVPVATVPGRCAAWITINAARSMKVISVARKELHRNSVKFACEPK